LKQFFFNVDVSVKQGSTLLPVLFALYLSSILYIFEKILKNLKIPISIIFVDDGLFVSQEKSLNVLNFNLFCSYHIMFFLLGYFELVIEQRKIEVFYFSKMYKIFNPSPLDLTTLGGPVVSPKEIW